MCSGGSERSSVLYVHPTIIVACVAYETPRIESHTHDLITTSLVVLLILVVVGASGGGVLVVVLPVTLLQVVGVVVVTLVPLVCCWY